MPHRGAIRTSFLLGLVSPRVPVPLVDFIPLNDFDALDHLFRDRGDRIAAVLLEPIMGNCGSIASTPAWLQQLRDTCTQYGSMLIIDEVKTGFRVARGGAQELYGIHADLTTYAKAMGNGYPVACLAAAPTSWM